jgi:hypothetical protein
MGLDLSKCPPAKGSEKTLLTFLDRLDEESRAAKDAAGADRWEDWIDLFRGQWKMPEMEGNPLFEANVIGATIDRKTALLTEQKPTVFIGPRKGGLKATADVLKNAFDAAWDEYSMELVLERLAYFVGIPGAGFVKLPWDREADFGRGDVVPTVLDPRTVRMDPSVVSSYDLDKAQYVCVETAECLWDVWNRFPGPGMMVKPDARITDTAKKPSEQRPGFMRRLTGMWRSKVNRAALEPGAIPRTRLMEYQFQDPALNDDGTRVYPQGRHIIRGGCGDGDDVILLDEANPYWDGQWDLEMLDGRPDLEHPWGRSEVAALRRVQESLNRIGQLYLENRIRLGYGWIVYDEQALTPKDVEILRKSGAICVARRRGFSVERQAPLAMPADFLEFAKFLVQTVDYLSGLADVNLQGRGRLEVRSGAQLEGLQQAGQTLVRFHARRLEGFLQRLGQKWISRIFQFWTGDRILTFLGPGEQFQQFTFERQKLISELVGLAQKDIQEKLAKQNGDGKGLGVDELADAIKDRVKVAWRDFTFRITPGSSLAVTKVQRALLFKELWQAGLGPGSDVLRALGEADPHGKMTQAKEEAAQFGPPPQPAKGQGGKKQAGQPAGVA